MEELSDVVVPSLIKYNKITNLPDYAYYYKFNSRSEIKLIKSCLEDNGFGPFCVYSQNITNAFNAYNEVQSLNSKVNKFTNQMYHNLKRQREWNLMWTTKVLKNTIFNRLTKTQKVN